MEGDNIDKVYLLRREIQRSVFAWLLSSEPAIIPTFDWVEILNSLPDDVVSKMYDYLIAQRKYGISKTPAEVISMLLLLKHSPAYRFQFSICGLYVYLATVVFEILLF